MRTTKPLLAVEQHGKLPQDVQCFMLLPEYFVVNLFLRESGGCTAAHCSLRKQDGRLRSDQLLV
jgi:hypothetical protein